MGRNGDYTQIVPLCRRHHQEMHAIGERTFQDRYAIDLDFLAILTEDQWREHEDGLAA